jgi:hypothetical protein
VDGDSGEWQRGPTALWQYVAFRGTAAVPPRAVAVGVAIGAWAEARRQNYWAGDLHPSCVAALESLPGWSWAGRSERRWSTRYAGAMPPDNAVAGRLHIGEWATAQRRAHAAGNLPKPLTEQLDALPGLQWTEDRWQRGLTALRAYLAQHETLEDVDGAEIHGFALGHWVKRCRDDYRSGSLNGWQIDDLESLPGWTWRGPDERWRQGIAALRAYYLRHGGAQPPRRAVVNGFAIGAWSKNVDATTGRAPSAPSMSPSSSRYRPGRGRSGADRERTELLVRGGDRRGQGADQGRGLVQLRPAHTGGGSCCDAGLRRRGQRLRTCDRCGHGDLRCSLRPSPGGVCRPADRPAQSLT